MPATINGTGTTYYGECRYQPDGSFQTTHWMVVIFFPLLPLRSYRVRRRPEADRTDGNGDTRACEVLGEVPLGYAQVMRTWAFAWMVLALVGTAAWFFFGYLDTLDRSSPAGIALAIALISAVLLPFQLLAVARRRARAAVMPAPEPAPPLPRARND